MKMIIVTGMSGAGKSTALNVLEDEGYYCVDNMPISLIPKFAELANAGEDGYSNIAIGVDIRSGHALAELDSVLDDMLNKHFNYTILFLESSDDVLVKRYKETRRTHPLAMDDHDRIDNVIKLERDELKFLKKRADVIIDTSQMLTRELKAELEGIFFDDKNFKNLFVTVLSFGFKYGIPADADLVFDVRFLPNPYYIEDLRPKTGDDKENFVIVIMGDGYTAGQQDQFLEDATQKARGMLTWSPYREYSDRINIYAVQAVSNEPGIGVYGGKSPDTYFHVKVYGKAAGFTNGGDERAKALRTELEENYLDEGANVGTIHILCNDTGSYGASVNPLFSFSTNSEDNSDGTAMAHEIAHSIGRLGDEYERYTNKPNTSDTANPDTIKWSKMLGFRGIGITTAGTDTAFAP